MKITDEQSIFLLMRLISVINRFSRKIQGTPDCEHDFEFREGNWHIQRDKPPEASK